MHNVIHGVNINNTKNKLTYTHVCIFPNFYKYDYNYMLLNVSYILML